MRPAAQQGRRGGATADLDAQADVRVHGAPRARRPTTSRRSRAGRGAAGGGAGGGGHPRPGAARRLRAQPRRLARHGPGRGRAGRHGREEHREARCVIRRRAARRRAARRRCATSRPSPSCPTTTRPGSSGMRSWRCCSTRTRSARDLVRRASDVQYVDRTLAVVRDAVGNAIEHLGAPDWLTARHQRGAAAVRDARARTRRRAHPGARRLHRGVLPGRRLSPDRPRPAAPEARPARRPAAHWMPPPIPSATARCSAISCASRPNAARCASELAPSGSRCSPCKHRRTPTCAGSARRCVRTVAQQRTACTPARRRVQHTACVPCNQQEEETDMTSGTNKKRLVGVLAGSAAFALVLAGCQTGGGDNGGGGDDGAILVGTTDKVTTLDPAGSYDNGSFARAEPGVRVPAELAPRQPRCRARPRRVGRVHLADRVHRSRSSRA